ERLEDGSRVSGMEQLACHVWNRQSKPGQHLAHFLRILLPRLLVRPSLEPPTDVLVIALTARVPKHVECGGIPAPNSGLYIRGTTLLDQILALEITERDVALLLRKNRG